MILDSRTLAASERLEADVCIVGAGAAGISMALELTGSGLDVLVVESGGFAFEAATQALYAGEVTDWKLHSAPDLYRQRMFGGSTTIWGGRCVPFDPIDFEARDWIPHSGWPIAYADVAAWYPKANALCEAGEYEYSAAKTQGCKAEMIEGFSSERLLTDSLERFSCPTDFGRRYRARLEAAANVRVLLHASCVKLCASADGRRIESASLHTLAGASLIVSAKDVVLATGGLEVPRLLLASRDVHPNGIGNAHDVVGRYYQCHVSGTIGALTFERPVSAIWHGYDVSWDGIYCRRRFTLSEDTQRRVGAGNFVGRLHFRRVANPAHRVGILSLIYLGRGLISYEYSKRLQDPEGRSVGGLLRHTWNVIADPIYTIQFLLHWLRHRTLAQRKFPSVVLRHRTPVFSLEFHGEQLPNPDSRVTLAQATDPFGMPRVKVDWRYTPGDVRAMERALEVVKQEIERSGCGRFEYDTATVEQEIVRYGAYGGHQIGTARMGADPLTSVVDGDCKVHGVENLHIASSAVFPTSSQANPTLTIVALALRLANHLRARAQCGESAVATIPAPAPAGTPAWRVLVLGGGGFIGRRLLAVLGREPGFQAIAGTRRPRAPGAEVTAHVKVDTLDAASVAAALAGCDAVVNCVAGSAAAIADGARVLFECAAQRSPKPVVVHLSTISVYGSATGRVDEHEPPRADIGWYGTAKIEAERHAAAYAAGGGSVVVLRPGIVYGPDSVLWTTRIARLLRRGRLGDFGAAGDGHCNLVYVDDVVRAIMAALRDRSIDGGIFNLADPAAGTWNDYFKAFARELGYVPVRRLSARRLKVESMIVAPPLKVAQIMAGKLGVDPHSLPELMPPSLVRLFAHDIVLDSRRATARLGLAWTPIPAALRTSAEWAKERSA